LASEKFHVLITIGNGAAFALSAVAAAIFKTDISALLSAAADGN